MKAISEKNRLKIHAHTIVIEAVMKNKAKIYKQYRLDAEDIEGISAEIDTIIESLMTKRRKLNS